MQAEPAWRQFAEGRNRQIYNDSAVINNPGLDIYEILRIFNTLTNKTPGSALKYPIVF